MPRVTVLISVHNGLPWLEEAVETVLGQTYSDFELLVVDDASTDGSGQAVEAWADERIRLLRNARNIGQVPSLNRGLQEARGEYVARLDADDRCLPTRLEKQVAILDAQPAVALTGTWLDVVSDGRLWARQRGHVGDYVDFLLSILSDRYPWGHPSLMYRRDVVLGLGGYDTSLAPSEDKDLYRRLALARHEARSVDEPLVLYRRHERQLSQERREVQKRNDDLSQDRFLAELAGEELAVPLRLLLAGDVAAWKTDVDYPAALRRLLAGARDRLSLDERETAKLERQLGALLARHACAAWRAGPRAQWLRTPAVFVFASRRGGRRQAPVYVLSLLAGWALLPLGALRRLRVARLRVLARRSRTLRRLYARLPGD